MKSNDQQQLQEAYASVHKETQYNESMNKQSSWVMYTVQNEDDQSWGGWDDYSHHDKLAEALEELEDLKKHGKICRVVQVTTEVVA